MDIIKEIERLIERVDEHDIALHNLAAAPVLPPTPGDQPEIEAEFPELVAYPENAFAPPPKLLPVKPGQTMPGPGGPMYERWHPEPDDFPDFMDFFLMHGAGRENGVVLPHVKDEPDPYKAAINFTWRTNEPEYGCIQLIYPEPNDFKNPYSYEPFRVVMFRGDERAPEDWTGAPNLKMAQMLKGDGNRLGNRSVLFDVLPDLPSPAPYSPWHASLYTHSTFRVSILPNMLPEGTRLKITINEGIRPEEPVDNALDNACGGPVERRTSTPLGPGGPDLKL